MKENLELSRVRDFGELINDTFVFVKQNWKPLFKAILIIAGFFILASMSVSIYSQSQLFGVEEGNPMRKMGRFTSGTFIASMMAYVAYMVIGLVTFSYILLYKEKGNQPASVEEVWNYVKYFFWRYLGGFIVFGLMMLVGFVLCVIPGLYLMPVVSLMMAMIVFENAGIGYVFDRSFKLIKNEWWTVFGALMVMAIVMYALMIAIVIPVSLITGAGMFVTKSVQPLPVLIAVNIFSHVGYIFTGISYILIGLVYYSLVEKKEGSSLFDKIENIGKSNSSTDLPEEEY